MIICHRGGRVELQRMEIANLISHHPTIPSNGFQSLLIQIIPFDAVELLVRIVDVPCIVVHVNIVMELKIGKSARLDKLHLEVPHTPMPIIGGNIISTSNKDNNTSQHSISLNVHNNIWINGLEITFAGNI